jgi:hypothetical protein
MDFADAEELQVRWRPFTSDAERARAVALLGVASRLIRSQVPDVDARIAAGTLDPMLVGDVAVDVVRRAMVGGVPGAQQSSTTVDGVSQSYTYGNPMGNLYVTSDELRRIARSAGGRAFSISLIPVVDTYIVTP